MEIRYIDTRGNTTEPLAFTQALLKGIAPGGGLFVPEQIPRMTLDEIVELADMTYAQRAAFVYKRFGIDFDEAQIDSLMQRIYGSNFDTPDICPIVPVGDGMHVLELWHGPTSAFKDMALQCLPVFFSASVEKQRNAGGEGNDYLIAVATSGDTGKAALEGFADRDHISIIVFYPDGGVSDIQYKQMATQRGANVCVCGVRGNFDDCQTSVKHMFGDDAFNARLLADRNIALSSANSINWGRLLPQIVYYISSYAVMVKDGSVVAGNSIDVTVPTGNFGNILACWYAKQIGVPIDRIVCASNTNRVLADFIETGVYDIADRPFVLTPSPSMDILVSSNLERQLFELTGRDPEMIRTWMSDLRDKGRFEVDEETFAALQSNYRAGSVDNEACLETIREVFEDYSYLLDPHSAVAWKVAVANKSDNPMLVVSTANWAKFGANVYRGLTGIDPEAPLPAELDGLTDVQINRKIYSMTHACPVPPALDELDDKQIRFTQVINSDVKAIEEAALGFVK
jgi:threonine synthase